MASTQTSQYILDCHFKRLKRRGNKINEQFRKEKKDLKIFAWLMCIATGLIILQLLGEYKGIF